MTTPRETTMLNVRDWPVSALIEYLDEHTDEDGDWDGAEWPAGMFDPEYGQYLCPVCADHMPEQETPHDGCSAHGRLWRLTRHLRSDTQTVAAFYGLPSMINEESE